MDKTQYSYAAIEPVKSESERCGGAVRWRKNDGALEQLWIITEYTGSSPSGRREEWRAVPTIGELH